MRKNIFLLITIIGLLMFISCESFLDLKPKSVASTVNFYKDASDITVALNGCYASLQSNNMYRADYVTMMEVRSDNVSDNNSGASGGIYYDIDRFTLGADNNIIRNVWAASFNHIYRINSVLDNTHVINDEALKLQYESEAHFLRALTYFNIVRLWGAVPIITNAITTHGAYGMKRERVDEVYNFIEKDLMASQNLPRNYNKNDDLGRATVGAAKALLAKVYLTQYKYSEANKLLEELVDEFSDIYHLEDNIFDVFDISNKLNNEIIFAIRYSKTIIGENASTHDAYGKFDLDNKLYDLYETSDNRKELLDKINIEGQFVVRKFADTKDPTTLGVGFDFPVIRYSDVLLMHAEVLNEMSFDNTQSSKALMSLNAVRKRSNASVYDLSELSTQELFREAVLKERRLELALENHRWFDLVRTGQAINAMSEVGITISNDDLLYPIPESEVHIMNDSESFPQNPGY